MRLLRTKRLAVCVLLLGFCALLLALARPRASDNRMLLDDRYSVSLVATKNPDGTVSVRDVTGLKNAEALVNASQKAKEPHDR